jgi:hypothetical protein
LELPNVYLINLAPTLLGVFRNDANNCFSIGIIIEGIHGMDIANALNAIFTEGLTHFYCVIGML